MLHDGDEVGGLGVQIVRGGADVVAKSNSDSGAQDRQIDEIDLRGLICSAIHEYRVSEAPVEMIFIDEHPYAIISGDRAALIATVRTFFDFAIQESCGQRLTVRLYSIGDELCVEVADETENPEATRTRQSAQLQATGGPHLGLGRGWLRFGHATEGGATLTMSFRSS